MNEYKCHNCSKVTFDATICPVCGMPHCRDCIRWPNECCSGCNPASPHTPTQSEPGEATEDAMGGAQGGQKVSFDVKMASDEALEALKAKLQGKPDDAESEGGGEPDSWSLYLTGMLPQPPLKIPAIKAVRQMTSLSLKDAKDVVDYVSGGIGNEYRLMTGLAKPLGEYLRAQLADAGLGSVLRPDEQPEQPEPPADQESADLGIRQFVVYAHFSEENAELGENLQLQGLSGKQVQAIWGDGRFGKHGEVALTCIVDESGSMISVIDCDYLD